jgi:hypothetical protein
LPYAAVAFGIAATLVLFVSLKLEMQRTARRERKRVDVMLARLDEASTGGSDPVFVPVSLPAHFHRNRRVQAARLLRKGEDTAHVAAALGMPRAEVELLARVMSLGHPAAAVATAGD